MVPLLTDNHCLLAQLTYHWDISSKDTGKSLPRKSLNCPQKITLISSFCSEKDMAYFNDGRVKSVFELTHIPGPYSMKRNGKSCLKLKEIKLY